MLLSATAVNTLADLFHDLEQRGRSDLLMHRRGSCFTSIGSREFADQTRRCAAALAALGVGRGDRVGMICSNRPEWHVIDFACHLRGAVPVPLFSSLTPAQVSYIFADSGCKVVFAEGDEQLAKVAEVLSELPDVEHLVRVRETGASTGAPADAPVDGPPDAALDAGPDDRRKAPVQWALAELLADHAPANDVPGPESDAALATIIYTSGTTGPPKGVMLTHANLVSNIRGARKVLSCRPVDTTLSVLPLCHVFERVVDYTFLSVGARIAYGSPATLAEDYVLVRPTVVAGVPRLFERFRAAVVENAAAGGAVRQRLFRWAEGVGRRRAEHELAGGPWGPLDALRFAVADRLVLRKVRAAAGGRIYHFVSGGAALDPSLNWWFEAMGLRLLQGYGLTETSPVISANPHEANRIGTVGIPLPDVEVKVASDGEILTRGPHVMEGYWRQPEATAECIVDGWFHTGDIGTFEDGYLSVTDRKKYILVTSTGKNVAPQPIENAIAQSSFIEQVTLVGDGRPFIGALIVPDFAALNGWASTRGQNPEPRALCADRAVIELIGAEVDRQQADFASFERVRDFRLLPRSHSIGDGTLTPTLKAVRSRVEDRYAALIEEMYGGGGHGGGDHGGGGR